jgi:hypothetical protein
MWSEEKRRRFQELRRDELERELTPEEEGELSALIRELEEAEAAYLRPANERLRRERERIEAQNRTLQETIKRKQALIAQIEHDIALAKEGNRT